MPGDSQEAIQEFKRLMAEPAARAAFVEIKRERARDYEHVFRAIFATPWAMLEDYMPIIASRIMEHYVGVIDTEEHRAQIEAARRAEPAKPQRGVAVLPIHGVIVPKGGMLDEVSGATSIASLRQGFRAAMAAKEVNAIVLDVDSPGGNAAQIPEMAAEIRAARGTKPIIAAVSGMAASAAYWLASQADEIVVTPSGSVGSIGVLTAHEDMSAAAEKKGVKTTLISAGKFKTEGNPFEPLSAEGREHAQMMVDEIYATFVNDVALGRGVPDELVREGFGEGRLVSARNALELGMADRLGAVDETIGRLLVEPTPALASNVVSFDTNTVSIGSNSTPVWDNTTWVPSTAKVESFDPEFPDDAGDPLPEDPVPEEPEPVPVPEPVALRPARAEVDNSSWDGGRAMAACSSAADYRSICAGERSVGTPDERQHWALPHHYLGRGPNAAGVRNALARLPQTQGLTNRGRAQSHLDAHMREINPDRTAAEGPHEVQIALLREDPTPSAPLV